MQTAQTLANGRYELGPVVGSGGMALVRRATDTVLHRPVAVKLFRADLDEASAARARTEMQTLAGLTHPGLVAVHDAGTETDPSGASQPYLVMELVEGPTLAESCRDGGLTPERLVAVGADVAAALDHVHGLGIVHRDVKPANILLSPSGAKLADFGVARIVDGVRHTGTGLTIGTAPYLAPEQVTGDHIGPATDVYALGLVLLECLTGRREYSGGPVECAMARLHRRPDVPDTLPAPWPALLRAMTERDPADRPTAAQVARTLRGGAVEEAAPPTSVLPSPQTRLLTTPIPAGASPVRSPRVPRVVRSGRARGGALTPARVLLGLLALVLLAVALVAALRSLDNGGGPAQPATPRTPLEQHLQELQKAVTP